jgi:peptide subunit release factor 1 (eRF1)
MSLETLSIPDGLLSAKGPFLSLYLDVRADTEDGPKQIELRWRALRDKAADAGVQVATLEAIDQIVDDAHRRGDGLAVIAAGDKILLRRHLGAQIDDSMYFGQVPDLQPLLQWHQENPNYLVVLADRTGADIYALQTFEVEEAQRVQGEDDQVQKVNPGGWAQRRYQQHAENLWEQNAKEVAERVSELAGALPVEFVGLAGDVRALGFLKEHLDEPTQAISFDIGELTPYDLSEIADDLHKAIGAHVGWTTEQLLQKFLEERGQKDLAADGLIETCAALRASQAATVLVSSAEARNIFLIESDPAQVAHERKTLEDLGIDGVIEVPARIGLARAAVATGASVRVIPELSERHGPADGVGALLRFAFK